MPEYLTSPTCWLILAGSFAATTVLTPFVMRLARRLGAVDKGGYRKINKERTPLMGGLAIVIPLLGVCLLGLLRPTSMFGLVTDRHGDFMLLLLGGFGIAMLGALDDLRGLGAKAKFAVQIAIALLMCLGGKTILAVNLPLVGSVYLGPVLGSILTVLWIVGMINAINLVDGLDGLAAGLSLISALGLGVIAAVNGQTFTVLIALALTGNLLAFLRFNSSPARIFLGDTGSLFLGYTLAMLGLMGSSKASGGVMLLGPALALGFPIFDTMTSMLRRILRGRNPFVGDRSHTHHRLLDYGYSQRQTAFILYSIALMCVISAILSQIIYPKDTLPLVGITVYALVVVTVAWANGYLRLRHIWRVARCRERNSMFAAFNHWAAVSLKAENTSITLQDTLAVGLKEMNLSFLEVSLENPDILIATAKAADDGQKVLSIDPVETIRVADAEGIYVRIRYQLSHTTRKFYPLDVNAREIDKLERQDVMACLAHLFSQIRIATLARGDIIEMQFEAHQEEIVGLPAK